MAKGFDHDQAEVEALRAALAAAEARADQAEAAMAIAVARTSDDAALIAHLRLQIAKLTRTVHGQRSERTQRLLDQYELQLEELEASAAAEALKASGAAAKAGTAVPPRDVIRHGSSFRRTCRACVSWCRARQPARAAAASVCPSSARTRPRRWRWCGGAARRWTVIQTVCERFSCRDCEGISQPPAPFHAVPRGWAGPSLLAMVLFEKYDQDQPLNRQAVRYAREGVPLSLSTFADQVGGCAAALQPLFDRLRAHVMAADRLHGDDTPVPVLAKGKTTKGRVWVYGAMRENG